MRNMNDFKFRGYDTKLEKMTYFDDEDYLLSYGQILRSKIEWDYNYAEKVGYEDVTNEIILMQYTGLKDKNGKEIYEGDILQHLYDYCDKTDRYIVAWDNDDLQYSFENIHKRNTYMALEDFYDDYYGDYSIEVIGNIYDNPELLGGE